MAKFQVENGAQILDINMDKEMLEEMICKGKFWHTEPKINIKPKKGGV